MPRLSPRRPAGGNQYPLWIAVASLAGLTVLSQRGAPDAVPETDAGTTPAPATSAPSSDAAPFEGPSLTWHTEGTRELPSPPELLACLAGHSGRTPALAPVRVGDTFATEVSWLGPPLRQRIEASASDQPPGLRARTRISGRPHAALAVHLALGACLRPGATSLLDAELGRRYLPADWPAPLPGGGLDVASLFAQELRNGLLVSRGLTRLGLPELAVQTAPGLSPESVRVQLQKAIVAAVVAGVVEDQLTLDGVLVPLRRMTLPGLGEVRALARAPGRRTPSADTGPAGPGARDRRPPAEREAGSQVPPERVAPSRPPIAPIAKPLDIDYR